MQGFWGGELALGVGKTSSTYEYGNPMTVATPTPTSGFGMLDFENKRTLESKGGLSFTGGLRGFVGVEYFIAKQLSLGGEFTLGFDALVKVQDEVTSQKVENGEVREAAVRSRSANTVASSYGLRTVTEVSIFLLFYF